MSDMTADTQALDGSGAVKVLAADRFGSILSEELDWISFPAYPPQVKLAVLVGNPKVPGPHVVRVRLPGGT